MATKHLSRRDFLRAGVLTTAGAVVTACAPPAAPPAAEPAAEQPAAQQEEPQAAPATQDKVTIDFWYGWTPDLITKTLDSVAAKFTEKMPNVEVKTAQHEWGEKLLTAYAAGTPPDVHEHYLAMQFGARDLTIPLDDRIAASSVIKKDLIDDRIWSVAIWNGKAFAVPNLAFFAETGMVINKAVYDNAGLKTPDDAPKTWDEVYAQAKQYTKTDDAGNLELLWVSPDKGSRWWAAMYGLTPYNANDHQWTVEGAEWEEVVNNIARFYTDFDPQKIEGFFQAYPAWVAVPGNAFASDRLAMILSGYWIPGELDKNAPGKEFFYTWVPTGGKATGKKVAFWGAHSMMIPKQSKHPDEAWLLTEHYADIPAAQEIFEGPGWISPKQDFWDVMNVNRYKGLDYFVNEAAKQAEEVSTFPASPALAYYQNHFQPDVVDPVIYGDKDVKTALADFTKALNDEEVRVMGEG
jgi:ABC-type glycerol-3-phosphate transport system substrate-binding protein